MCENAKRLSSQIATCLTKTRTFSQPLKTAMAVLFGILVTSGVENCIGVGLACYYVRNVILIES